MKLIHKAKNHPANKDYSFGRYFNPVNKPAEIVQRTAPSTVQVMKAEKEQKTVFKKLIFWVLVLTALLTLIGYMITSLG
jgi:hypothetical protein